jgi:hypothetical protein
MTGRNVSLSNRVGLLEAKVPAALVTHHRIIQRVGQTLDDAIDEYGRDRIADSDAIVCRRIVPAAIRVSGVDNEQRS